MEADEESSDDTGQYPNQRGTESREREYPAKIDFYSAKKINEKTTDRILIAH